MIKIKSFLVREKITNEVYILKIYFKVGIFSDFQ